MPWRTKKKIKNFSLSPFLLAAIGFVVLAAIGWPLYKNIIKQHIVNQEIDNLKSEIGNLEEEKNGLDGLLLYLKSDHFVEEQARMNLNLRKQGEDVAVVRTQDAIQKANDGQDQNNQNGSRTNAESNPEKWLKYFFN